jgi:hypothetical protein
MQDCLIQLDCNERFDDDWKKYDFTKLNMCTSIGWNAEILQYDPTKGIMTNGNILFTLDELKLMKPQIVDNNDKDEETQDEKKHSKTCKYCKIMDKFYQNIKKRMWYHCYVDIERDEKSVIVKPDGLFIFNKDEQRLLNVCKQGGWIHISVPV